MGANTLFCLLGPLKQQYLRHRKSCVEGQLRGTDYYRIATKSTKSSPAKIRKIM